MRAPTRAAARARTRGPAERALRLSIPLAAALALVAACYSVPSGPCALPCGAGSSCPAAMACAADGFCHAGDDRSTCAPVAGVGEGGADEGGSDAAPDAPPDCPGNLLANGDFASGTTAPWLGEGSAPDVLPVVDGGAMSRFAARVCSPDGGLAAMSVAGVSGDPTLASGARYTLSAWVRAGVVPAGADGGASAPSVRAKLNENDGGTLVGSTDDAFVPLTSDWQLVSTTYTIHDPPGRTLGAVIVMPNKTPAGACVDVSRVCLVRR